MSESLIIRPTRATDRDDIGRIIGPIARAGEVFALPLDMTDDEALDYWTGQGRETFVAEADGTILGTSYLKTNQQGGGSHVANGGYATTSSARGRGVARRMCEHSLVIARERGFRAMQFNFVVASNTSAVRLWQSLGFEAVGRLPGAFAHPTRGFVDALVMYKSL